MEEGIKKIKNRVNQKSRKIEDNLNKINNELGVLKQQREDLSNRIEDLEQEKIRQVAIFNYVSKLKQEIDGIRTEQITE